MSRPRDIHAVWETSRKRWLVRVQMNGIRRKFTSGTPGRAGRIEAEERATAWLNGTENVSERDPTIKEAAEEWLEEVLSNVGKTSWRQYNTHIRNYVIPVIGDLRFSQLTNEQQLQNVINKAFKSGARNGKPLMAKSLLNLRGALSGFLKFARKCGYTTMRMENVEIPKKAEHGVRRAMQPQELRTLFSSETTVSRGQDVSCWYIHAFRFHVLTGLRPGELIGLKWGDIRDGICSITRSINYHGEVTPGKNYNARRTFLVPMRALGELDRQREMLDARGVKSEYVFPRQDGEPVPHKTYRRELLRYCERNDIEDTCPYELRHTWYSVNKLLPAELVKQMGGHSESMDTFGVYGHQLEGEAERFAAMLDDTVTSLLSLP